MNFARQGCLKAFVLVSVLGTLQLSLIHNAKAGLSEIGLGGSYISAMGSAYETIGKAAPLGLHFDAWMDSWSIPGIQTIFSVQVEKFDVKNMVAPGASVYFLGTFLGLEARSSGKDMSLLRASFAAEVGGVYDWLSFKDVTGTVQNSALSLAAQIVPGVACPLGNTMSAALDFPVTLIFTKTPLALWSGSFSLRWKL